MSISSLPPLLQQLFVDNSCLPTSFDTLHFRLLTRAGLSHAKERALGSFLEKVPSLKIQDRNDSFHAPAARRLFSCCSRSSPSAYCLFSHSTIQLTFSFIQSELGFIHVEAPILTNSDCEGGSSVFRVESDEHFPSPSSPSQQQHLHPDQQLKSFFSSPTYLTVSSQLYLEAISASISRVFTLGPAFRAERSLTSRHLSEFWMLEGELSFIEDLSSLLDVVEGCVRAAQRSALDVDVSFSPTLSTTADNRGEHIQRALKQSWPRVSYDEAIRLLNAHHGAAEWGADLSTEQERWLAEQHFQSPVFVTDYPASLKPFYMRRNASSEQRQERQQTVACFDLLVPGVGELAGGSLREERMDVLLESMRAKGLDKEDYEWYLDLRKYGTVPHGGFGLGWERLISWMSGLDNVRECIAFPRAKEGFKV